MRRYLLDTNIVSEFRKNKPHGAVLAWVNSTPQELLFVPSVVFGELQAGAERVREQDPKKAAEIDAWISQLFLSAHVINMDVDCFREWARLMNHKSDDLIEDAMIAATARIHGLTVATRNESDFKHFGVELFNPFKMKS